MSFDLLRFYYLFLITRTANLPDYGATSLPAKMASNECAKVPFSTRPEAHKCPSRGAFVGKGLQCLHTRLPASFSHLALLWQTIFPLSLSPAVSVAHPSPRVPGSGQPALPELPPALDPDSQPVPHSRQLGIHFRRSEHTSGTKIAWVKKTEEKPSQPSLQLILFDLLSRHTNPKSSSAAPVFIIVSNKEQNIVVRTRRWAPWPSSTTRCSWLWSRGHTGSGRKPKSSQHPAPSWALSQFRRDLPQLSQ